MSKLEARKLLGGYATGTLRPEEMRALFEAALEDQELFDQLQREQTLRETLDDPAMRRQVLAAVTPAMNVPRAEPRWNWLLWAPVAGLAAAIIVLFLALRSLSGPSTIPGRQFDTARLQSPAAPVTAQPAPPPVNAPTPPPRRHREHASVKPLTEEPAPPPAPAGNSMAAVVAEPLQYTILKRDESGEFVPASATSFHAGDIIRIRVRANYSGRISLLENSVGESIVNELPENAIAGTDYLLPVDGNLTVQPGTTLAVRFIPGSEEALRSNEAGQRDAAITIPIHLAIE